MSIVAAILTALSALLYGAPLPANWAGFVITFVLMALSFATLSVLIGVVAPSSRAATLLSQLVYLPSVLPATQAMRAFNTIAFAGEPFATAAVPLLVLAASVAVNLALCATLFAWDPRTSRPRFLALLAVVPFAVAVVLG